MRVEKTFLVEEIAGKVKDIQYLYLVDFNRVTVSETAQLRAELAKEGAHFHVVKNTILRRIGESLSWPSLTPWLAGQTAIIYGGENPSGVVKLLLAFAKDKEKLNAKGGWIDGQVYDAVALEALSKLPDLPTLKATFLTLLLTPCRQSLYALQAVPQNLLNVLRALENRG